VATSAIVADAIAKVVRRVSVFIINLYIKLFFSNTPNLWDI
jgi:hypothetical protein